MGIFHCFQTSIFIFCQMGCYFGPSLVEVNQSGAICAEKLCLGASHWYNYFCSPNFALKSMNLFVALW